MLSKASQRAPSIWIGGEGDELLKVAAHLADGCNFVFKTPRECKERLEALATYCSDSGREFEEIQKSVTLMVLMDKGTKKLERKLSLHLPREASEREFMKRHIVGPLDVCIEMLKEYVSLGVSQFMLLFPDAKELNMCIKLNS